MTFKPQFSYEATTLDYLSPQWYEFRPEGGGDGAVTFATKAEAEAFLEAKRPTLSQPVATRVLDLTPKTDEFLEAEFAANRQFWADRAAAERAREAATPSKGKTVEVFKGRNVPVGTTGFVIWYGEGKWGWRVGIKDAQGEVWWTAASNVRVVTEEKEAVPA